MLKLFIFLPSLLFALGVSDDTNNLDTCHTNEDDSKVLKFTKVYNCSNGLTSFIFKKFTRFEDFYLSCGRVHDLGYITSILIVPKNPMTLDHSLKMEKIFKPLFKIYYTVYLFKINGFKVFDKKLAHVSLSSKWTFLSFTNVKLFVYINESHSPYTECSIEQFQNMTNSMQPYASLGFFHVFYPKEGLCPLVFNDSQALQITFHDLTNSFLYKNQLKFRKIQGVRVLSGKDLLRIEKFNYLKLFVYNENLYADLLNVVLFEKMLYLEIRCLLPRIEAGLLNKFKSVKRIGIYLSNLREFFHFETKWINTLNSEVRVDFANPNEVQKSMSLALLVHFAYQKGLVSFDRIYTYPDEDFCLFRDFPHSRLVLPIIIPGREIECTCTLKWLQMYTHLYSRYFNITTDYSQVDYTQYYLNIDHIFYFQSCDLLACNFETRLNDCNVSQAMLDIGATLRLPISDMGVYLQIKSLQFILLVVAQPILCVIGIVNNTILIVVIKNKTKQKLFKGVMYKHALVNSIFNIFYCACLMPSLVSTCVFFELSNSFCSKVYQTESAQYFKIISGEFMVNTLKSGTNISYLFFSLSRYILASNLKEKYKICKRFESMNLIFYSCLVILFSASLSVFKLFDYAINDTYAPELEFPYEVHNGVFCTDQGNHCRLFDVLKIVNSSINDIVFFVLNIIIDLFLFSFIKEDMKRKLAARGENADKSDLIRTKKNLNYMIVFFGAFNIVSHAPEFCMTILLLIYRKRLVSFFEIYDASSLVNDEARFFTLVSIAFQFYLFLVFNKYIRESFYDLLGRLFGHS